MVPGKQRKQGQPPQAIRIILIILLKKRNQFHNTTLFLRLVSIMNKSQQDLTTDYPFIKKTDLGIGNGDFHLDSWLNTDGSDLLDNFRRAVQVNESLVDPHLESIPSLRTFTTRSFPCSYSQSLQQEKMETKHSWSVVLP